MGAGPLPGQDLVGGLGWVISSGLCVNCYLPVDWFLAVSSAALSCEMLSERKGWLTQARRGQNRLRVRQRG